MSRAFVSESDRDDEPELPELKNPLPPGSRNYITAWGMESLTRELRHLEDEEKPRVAAALNDARESAGESTTPELVEARRQSALVDRRLAYLADLRRRAEVVIPRAGKQEVVTFGAVVRVRDKEKLVDERYQIVGVYEADPDHGLVSWVSPIARALKGFRIGDLVEVPLPEGPRILKIIGIDLPGNDPLGDQSER